MSVKIIYHQNCADGICAAYAAWKYYQTVASRPGGFDKPIELLPMHYGDIVPLIVDSDVVIVDFSLSKDLLVALGKLNKKLILIDHHKTAMPLKDTFVTESRGGLTQVIKLEQGRAGCVLAWEYFFPDTPMPGLFSYVGDRDLWQWQLHKSQEINAALRKTRFTTMEEIDAIIADWQPDKLAKRGARILVAQAKKVAQIASKAPRLNIAGYLVPCIENKVLISEVCAKLLELNPDAPFTACWFEKEDGKHNFSLRSRAEFDCSRIAKMFGGGGHAQASGFDVEANFDVSLEAVKGEHLDDSQRTLFSLATKEPVIRQILEELQT